MVKFAVPAEIGPLAAMAHAGNIFNGYFPRRGFGELLCQIRQSGMLPAVGPGTQLQTMEIRFPQTGDPPDDRSEIAFLCSIRTGNFRKGEGRDAAAGFLLDLPQKTDQRVLISRGTQGAVMGKGFL